MLIIINNISWKYFPTELLEEKNHKNFKKKCPNFLNYIISKLKQFILGK